MAPSLKTTNKSLMGSEEELGASQIEAPKGIIKEGGGGIGKVKEEEEYCKTPTGSGNRIPEIQNCPPAPTKRRPPFASSLSSSSSSSLLMRRSFADQLEFFENARIEEVESFFQSISMDEFSRTNKRCRSRSM